MPPVRYHRGKLIALGDLPFCRAHHVPDASPAPVTTAPVPRGFGRKGALG